MKLLERSSLSPGAWVIILLAVVSTIGILVWRIPPRVGKRFWTFSINQDAMYGPEIRRWNAERANNDEKFSPSVIGIPALERRLLSGLLSGTPIPDVVEVEIAMVGKFFSGPLDAVGFTDLTEILQREGLMEQINAPSFSPWRTRGRIFGIPHDVHPVMLAYRADIVEAAGIDVNQIETWEDFVRLMTPLMKDENGDGYPDRYLLSVWETSLHSVEGLLLQAGGGFFDEAGKATMNSAINAKVISTIVSWVTGPNRIGANAPPFDAEGNQKFLDGYVLTTLMPDWMAGIWMQDLPQMKGKMKLMPLPAWEKGGRRTSVLGGSMLAIPKRVADFAGTWDFAKRLYLNPEMAEKLYRQSGIISPIRTNWTNPVYDEPNPYFSGQPIGRLFINLAPDVPDRPSSAYKVVALTRMIDAAIRIKRVAQERGIFDVPGLLPIAEAELGEAQAYIERKMSTNIFLDEGRAQVSK